MFKPFDQFNYANSWMKYAVAYSQMSIAASEVILRRSIRMSQGAMTAPEVITATEDRDVHWSWVGVDDRGVEPADEDILLVIHVMPTALRRNR